SDSGQSDELAGGRQRPRACARHVAVRKELYAMKTISLLWLGVLLIPGIASGQSIELRVSVHVILNPTNGVRPTGVTDGLFRTAEANANEWTARDHRVYRLRVTEITNVGGPTQGGFSGPSKWFGQDFHGYPQPWLT